MVTTVRLDKMSAVPAIAPEFKRRFCGHRYDWIKCLLFQLLYLRFSSQFVPMSNRKNTNKKVLLPVSVHPLVTGYHRTV